MIPAVVFLMILAVLATRHSLAGFGQRQILPRHESGQRRRKNLFAGARTDPTVEIPKAYGAYGDTPNSSFSSFIPALYSSTYIRIRLSPGFEPRKHSPSQMPCVLALSVEPQLRDQSTPMYAERTQPPILPTLVFRSKTAAGLGLAVAGPRSQSSSSPYPCSRDPATLHGSVSQGSVRVHPLFDTHPRRSDRTSP